jgi:hypothetical protein
MSASIKTCAASLLLAATFAALAADAPPDAGEPAMTPSAQIAVRDATTGRLRAPTAAEVATLHAAGAQALRGARPAENLTRYHRSGATGARLNDNFMSYAVIVRQPDGRLTEYCFASLEAAQAAVAAGPASSSTNNLPTE